MYRIYSVILALLAIGYLPLFLVRKVWGAGYPVALLVRDGAMDPDDLLDDHDDQYDREDEEPAAPAADGPAEPGG